jgi:hypothetical protein
MANSKGLPISGAIGSGQVTLAVHRSFDDTEGFSIRSIVPAPEVDPDFAAGYATLLLSALAMARGRYVRWAILAKDTTKSLLGVTSINGLCIKVHRR